MHGTPSSRYTRRALLTAASTGTGRTSLIAAAPGTGRAPVVFAAARAFSLGHALCAARLLPAIAALAATALCAVPLSAQDAVARDRAARVDALFAEWAQPGSPGAAVAVIRNGEIVLERGYGSAQLEHRVPITPQTIFHVASVSKQFTAFAVALLDARGALSLDDDVRTHIPELPDFGRRLTLRQLIHHTSGIRDQWELLAMAGWRLDDVITKDHVLQLATRQRELNFEPGAEHLYSNMGYTLLAEVVARVGGMPFPEWLRVNVFEPLGMHATHMHDDHEHVVPNRAYSYRADAEAHTGWRNAVLSYANAGATSMFTTAADLARWLHNFETAELGGAALLERMRERGVLTSGDTLPYAFAIVRGEHRGRTTWSHGGADAGFRSIAVHYPDERLGVVVLSNLASFNPGRLANAVADIYLGDDAVAASPASAPPPAAAPHSIPARVLESYAGRWDITGVGLVSIRRDGGSLVLITGDGGRLPMQALTDSTFRVQDAVVRFVRDDGTVDRLVATSGGSEVAGRRMPAPTALAAELDGYAGSYYSPELEAVYRIVATSNGLVARHVRHGDIPLTAVDRDLFAGDRWFFGRVTFTRGAAGDVDGFRLTGGRVRDLRFIRLGDGALPK